MGRWFKDSGWDHTLERNTEAHQHNLETLNDPSVTDYNNDWLYDDIEYEFSFLEYESMIIEPIVNIIFTIMLINRFIIKKDFTIKNSDYIFTLGLLIRIAIPEINIVLFLYQGFKISKKVASWVKTKLNEKQLIEAK